MVGVTATLVGLVLVAAGGYGAYVGLARRGPHQRVTGTSRTRAGALREPGTVELQGTVETAEVGRGTFESPVAQRESVVSAWSVEEYQERGDDGATWRTVASGIWSVPFRVADDSGSALVDAGSHAEAASVMKRVSDAGASQGITAGPVLAEFDRFPVVGEVDAEKPPPQHIADFVEREEALTPRMGDGPSSIDVGQRQGDRRYYERTLGPGDDAYVLGEATRTGAREFGEDRLVVTPGGPGGTFVVSNLPEERLAGRLGSARVLLVGGSALAVLGLLVIGFCLRVLL